ncbi:ABC transporter permease [Dokdonia pacifica]|uniref:ABC-2 type transport system permease protein n=1 Tax=Dokdonia pacifica TaxID=1627892 RepID=A0A239BKD3_9FLAO|nr:ABC transporter permease [Dokdonia pacifica]GGG29158.1 ABC transporter permease [Dokdonia pacifica]SNS07838.1 ABC-2 type transport system permease protein [Dokdonia pacifica]
MSVLSLIIKREYKARVRNKSFLIMTFLSPLILVGMVFLITYLTQLNSDTKRVIAFVDDSNAFETIFSNTDQTTYINLSSQGLETAKEVSENEEYYGLVHILPDTEDIGFDIKFYGKETPSPGVVESLEEKIENKLTNQILVNKGINPNTIDDVKKEINIGIENYSGEKSSKMSNWVKAGFGGAAGYLLMMFIIIYGNMVMRSVIEEKTNRIIEVIISSVKPFQLMLGKILGTTMAGITQFSIWAILGVVLLTVMQIVFDIDPSATTSVVNSEAQAIANDPDKITEIFIEIGKLPLLQLIVGFLVYFVGGYFLYSSIYAAIGAAVDNETDTQQFMLPIIMPLMLAIYVGFFAVIDNPHGTVATIFSIIPLTSPIVMLMRIPFDVPGWQIALSVTLLVASFIFTVWFGSKIYRVGILMYGKKPTYKELFKWLKY